MRKTYLGVLLALFMCLSPVMAVYADESLIPYDSGVPNEALKPRLVDAADLLTENEENTLLAHLDEISERQQCDVVLVTTNSLEGMWAQDFADDYYDYNGFGMGDAHDGIVLVVSMGEREWAFSTCGYGIDAFTDSTLYYMEDMIIPYLSDGDYYGAFLTYADQADLALTHARELETAEHVEDGENPYYGEDIYYAEEKTSLFDVLISVVSLIPISIIIGTIIAFFQKKRAEKQYSGLVNNSRAMTKLYSSNMNLTQDQVMLVGRGVHRIHSPRKKPNSGGSSSRSSRVGRSSVHRSSSGRSHGGRSGRF